MVELQKRGFEIVIGGCNSEIKSKLVNSIEALNMLLIYTGLNEGKDCSSNMYIFYF